MYEKFIEKYPESELAKAAKFEIEVLGVTDEEFDRILEKYK